MPGNELSRKALIDAAKQITDQCDALLSTGVAETLDCCTLAFLNDVLRGSGDPPLVPLRTVQTCPSLCMRPFAAHGAPVIASMPAVARCHRQPKRGEQHRGVAERSHLQRRMAGACGPRGARGARRELPGYMGGSHPRQSTYSRALLTLPNVYSLNVNSPADGARALVNSLVRLDRLPASMLEGLLLLQDAARLRRGTATRRTLQAAVQIHILPTARTRLCAHCPPP